MLWVTYPVSVPSCHDDRLFSVLYDNLRSNLVTIHRMGWAHDWTQRLDAFGQWYIFSFCLFPWYPQPTCNIPSPRVEHTTTPDDSDDTTNTFQPSNGAKTQDSRQQQQQQQQTGRGGHGRLSLYQKSSLSKDGCGARPRRSGRGATHGWMDYLLLPQTPAQTRKNIPVWFFFLSIQWPHNQVRAPALHARIPLPSLPHTPACAYVACARALISPASRRGSRLARQSS